MVQAGGSEPGKELAAETAEMVYTVQSDFESGREFYADLKGRMAGCHAAPAQRLPDRFSSAMGTSCCTAA